jgi:hypothetical protein
MNTNQCCIILKQGCIDCRRQVALVITCAVAPSICVFSVLDVLDVTLLVPRILRWLLDLWKISEPLF